MNVIIKNSLAEKYPNLAKEWHPTKNGNLKPIDVSIGSGKKVWWLYPYDDPKTGKHFDFEWQATISNRVNGSGCPYNTGKAIWIGFNDLATTHPQLAKEWHPTKNGDLKSTDVTANSSKKVWWLLPYDDVKTNKHFDFEWIASVTNRVSGRNCPFLSGQKVWKGFNDLETYCKENNMEYILNEWNYQKNKNLQPTDVTYGSNEKVWWFLLYDDPKTNKHFDFEWETTVNKRTSMNVKCPYLENKLIQVGFNDLATVNPKLAKQWHPTKNGNLKPTDVMANSHKKVWWLLSYDDSITGKHFDFEWQATIANRNRGNGCPYLSNRIMKLEYKGKPWNREVELSKENK